MHAKTVLLLETGVKKKRNCLLKARTGVLCAWSCAQHGHYSFVYECAGLPVDVSFPAVLRFSSVLWFWNSFTTANLELWERQFGARKGPNPLKACKSMRKGAKSKWKGCAGRRRESLILCQKKVTQKVSRAYPNDRRLHTGKSRLQGLHIWFSKFNFVSKKQVTQQVSKA